MTTETKAIPMKLLSRDELFAATTRRFKDITLTDDFHIKPLAGRTFRVWSMDAGSQAAYQSALIDPETGKPMDGRIREIKVRKVAASVGDEDGKLLFTESDVAQLMKLDAGLVDLMSDTADKLNVAVARGSVAKN